MSRILRRSADGYCYSTPEFVGDFLSSVIAPRVVAIEGALKAARKAHKARLDEMSTRFRQMALVAEPGEVGALIEAASKAEESLDLEFGTRAKRLQGELARWQQRVEMIGLDRPDTLRLPKAETDRESETYPEPKPENQYKATFEEPTLNTRVKGFVVTRALETKSGWRPELTLQILEYLLPEADPIDSKAFTVYYVDFQNQLSGPFEVEVPVAARVDQFAKTFYGAFAHDEAASFGPAHTLRIKSLPLRSWTKRPSEVRLRFKSHHLRSRAYCGPGEVVDLSTTYEGKMAECTLADVGWDRAETLVIRNLSLTSVERDF